MQEVGQCWYCREDETLACNTDTGTEEWIACAIKSCFRFSGLPPGCVTLQQVVGSSAGVLGWAAYNGLGIKFAQSPIYTNKIPKKEIEQRKQTKKNIPSSEDFKIPRFQVSKIPEFRDSKTSKVWKLSQFPNSKLSKHNMSQQIWTFLGYLK